jgi:hypothetical protein
MRTASCVTFERVESSPVLIFDEKDVTGAVPTEIEGEHRRTKRNREGNETVEEDNSGEGAGAAAEDIRSPRVKKNAAVRRLSYDNEDVLGAISQLPDDGKVEEEPQMTQAWNQDTESPTQPITPVPLTQPLTPVSETQDLEEGEIPFPPSKPSRKAG